MSHSLADQSSIIGFIEDNWQLGRIGDQSFDATSGSILDLFNFSPAGDGHAFGRKLILDPDSGEPVQDSW